MMFNIKKRKDSIVGTTSPSSSPLSGTLQSPLVQPSHPNFVSRQCPFKKFGCSAFLVSKAEFDNHLKDDAQFHLQLVVEKFDHQFDLHTQLMAHFTEQMEDQLDKTMKVVRNHTDSLGASFQSKLDEGVEKCMTFAKKVEQQQQQLAKRLITQQIQEKKISSPLVKGMISGDDSFDGASVNNVSSIKQQLETEINSLSSKLKKDISELSEEFLQKLERTNSSIDTKINRIEGEVLQKIDKRQLNSAIEETVAKKTDFITFSVESQVLKKVEEKDKKKLEQHTLLEAKVDQVKEKIKIIETQQLDSSSEIRKLKLESGNKSSLPASSSSMYISSSASANNINKNEVMEEVKKVEEKLNKKLREEIESTRSELSSLSRGIKDNRGEIESLEKDCKNQFDKQDGKIKQVEEDLKKSDSLLLLMQNNLKKYNEFVDREKERETERNKLQESVRRLEQNQKKIEAEIQEGNEQVERVLREEAISPIGSVPKSPLLSKRSVLSSSTSNTSNYSPPITSSQSSPKLDKELLSSEGENGVLWEYDPIINKWIRLAIKLKVERKPFAEGALREAYHTVSLGVTTDENYPLPPKHSFPAIDFISPISKNNEAMAQLKSGTKFVLKLYKKEAEQQTSRELYFEDVKMQMVCRDWGHKFNQKKPPKKIEFLMSWVVELVDRNSQPVLCSIEPLLVGEFKKNNSNYGAVLTNRSTPQAFSHFTYELSNKQMIIVDIQGVDDLYTDPQIHTPDGKGYGLGNLGKAGINKFITTHKCNAVCALLDLDVKLGGVLSGNNKKQLQQGTMVMPDIIFDLAPSDNTIKVGAKALPKADFSRKDLKCISTIQSFRERVNSICFFDNQKLLCAGYGDGTFRIFDVNDNWKCLHTVTGHRKSIESITCNSSYIFTSSPDHTIKVHALRGKDSKLVDTLIGHTGEVNCIVANEKYLFSCSYDKTIKMWDLGTFKEIKSFEGVHTKYIKALALSGRYLFSGGNDQTIFVWDTEEKSLLFNMQGHEDWVLSLHCCSSYLYSTSKDNVIKIWDLSNFSCIDTLKGHWNSVSTCVVKDRYLYSGAEDNSIKVWDLDTLENVYSIPKGHSLGVKCLLVFNNQIISTSFDGNIKIWEWQSK
ncbi:myosin heavy chain kinase A [Dictyostelium purpureum]|uniref:Myosin heavy chain kinase A n=1 Tax=Dictyostelium purpureum TaxID=5786 RepID=F0ZGA6_DICPU|nr:myosin heavy chain kinase A [Dictyostelium purpureum]EGC37011.1 myosin heavy chain kinase A [Dictyostelium purpureum]|eukprot:XP_003286439.1 myosin heavy chain kinase A [Dictyostelium purpureum]